MNINWKRVKDTPLPLSKKGEMPIQFLVAVYDDQQGGYMYYVTEPEDYIKELGTPEYWTDITPPRQN